MMSDIQRERKISCNQSLEEYQTERAHPASVELFFTHLPVLAEPLIADHRILPELQLLIREESRADAAQVDQQAGQLFLQTQQRQLSAAAPGMLTTPASVTTKLLTDQNCRQTRG